MERIETDILVIGAGSGGLSVAAGAVQMGARVVLLEGHKMGGDCLNDGCVPSKAMIAAGAAAQAQRRSGPFGVAPVTPQVDYAAVQAHVKDVIDTIAPVDSQARFEGLGVRVIRAFGRFVSASEVEAGGHRISARRTVIATGSAPFIPPIPGLDETPFLTNETLFDAPEPPRHLIIIGGGPVGLEMAQAHIRLGCQVTVIDGAQALRREDPDLVAPVLSVLRAEGVDLVEDTHIAQVRGEAGAVEVVAADGRSWRGSHLLIAVGRRPNIETLNLDAAGVETDAGAIVVDSRLRTSNRKVYAIGDVVGGAQFTHVAGYHAGVVLRSALFGLPSKTRDDHVPRVTYTDPELAQVGATEAEARARHGDRLSVTRFDLAHVDRAIAERRTDGFIKVMVVRGRPVGASIVGHQAGEIANVWALVLANRMKMSQISGMISPYPTTGELSKRAAGAYFSPKLFENQTVKKVVRAVQTLLP